MYFYYNFVVLKLNGITSIYCCSWYFKADKVLTKFQPVNEYMIVVFVHSKYTHHWTLLINLIVIIVFIYLMLTVRLHWPYSIIERLRQGHKDSTSDIYWTFWDTGKTRERGQSSSPSERSSRSSVTLDNDVQSVPDGDSTGGSRLSTLSTSDNESVVSPKQRIALPFLFTTRSDGLVVPLKRSVSDEVNLGMTMLCFSL